MDRRPPDNHASLRRWKGPDGDLETWSDPIVDRPVVGKYPELAAWFVAAIEAIARKRRQASGDGGLSILQAENGRLRIQNATLLGEIDTHQRRVQLLESLLRNAGRPSCLPSSSTASGCCWSGGQAALQRWTTSSTPSWQTQIMHQKAIVTLQLSPEVGHG